MTVLNIGDHHRHQYVLVDHQTGPDEHGRFVCLVNGGMERWTLERILRAIADHDDVQEWVR